MEVTELDGRVSLFDPATDEVLVLNETASEVWRLADGTLTIDGIVGRLAPIFDVAADEIRPEVASLVEDLRTRGLLPEISGS